MQGLEGGLERVIAALEPVAGKDLRRLQQDALHLDEPFDLRSGRTVHHERRLHLLNHLDKIALWIFLRHLSSPFPVGGAFPDDLKHTAGRVGINLCQCRHGEAKQLLLIWPAW